MMWNEWLVDATLGNGPADGLYTFVPYEREQSRIVFGMSYISNQPPHDGRVVGVTHEDGHEAVEAWVHANEDALQRDFPGLFAHPHGEGE